MRKVRYAVASSLDGFIAGSGGEADWIVHNPEVDFGELFRHSQALQERNCLSAVRNPMNRGR